MRRPGAYLHDFGGYHQRLPTLPLTSAHHLALTGVTPTALYLCNETSGALIDQLGGTSLAAGGAPVYAVPVDGRRGVRYPAGASHTADVNGIGVGSGWYGCIFTIADSSITLPGIVSRANAAFTECVSVYGQAGGRAGWSVQVRDNAAGQIVPAGVVPISAGSWLAQVQIDRAAATVRGRMSRVGGGLSEQVTGSIAGFGSVDGAGMSFGFGAFSAFGGGAAVAWCATALGVQCEGATFLAAMAQRLGVE